MAKQLICKFPFLGNVSIYLHDEKFAVFCQRQLFHYCTEVVNSSNGANDKLVFHGLDTEKTHVFDQDYRISRTAAIHRGELRINRIFRFHTKHYVFRSIDQETECAIEINESYAIKNAKRLLKRSYDRHHSLFYDVIIHPLVAMYYLMGGYYIVHGLLATQQKRGVLVYGLDGVGKSTCALELLRHGCSIEADNLVLCNGVEAIGLALPMRFNINDPIKSHSNFKEIFRDDKLKEFIVSDLKFESVQLVHAYKLVMTSQPFFVNSSERFDLSSLMVSYGAPETNAINSFCSPFALLRSQIADTNIAESPASLPHTIMGNVKGQINTSVQKILCALNTL